MLELDSFQMLERYTLASYKMKGLSKKSLNDFLEALPLTFAFIFMRYNLIFVFHPNVPHTLPLKDGVCLDLAILLEHVLALLSVSVDCRLEQKAGDSCGSNGTGETQAHRPPRGNPHQRLTAPFI